MAESKEESFKQAPLGGIDISTQHVPKKDVLVSQSPSSLTSSDSDTVVSQQHKDLLPESPVPTLTPEQEKELAHLREEIGTLQDQGLPSTAIANRISELTIMQAGGYSLEENRFAPGSVKLNTDPIGITPDGWPIYPYIKEKRGSGARMALPGWLEKEARYNSTINIDGLVKMPRKKRK